MDSVGTSLCFALDTVHGSTVVRLLDTVHVNFAKVKSRDPDLRSIRSVVALRKKLVDVENVVDVSIETREGIEGPIIQVSEMGAWSFTELSVIAPLCAHPPVEIIDGFTGLAGFTFASSASDDLTHEGEDLSSANSGRRTLFPGMWLHSAWRMWFGVTSFDVFPRQKLLTFGDADSIRELPSGAIYVQLFSDPFDAATARGQRRQAAFRDHMDMDVLEKKANDLAFERSDPLTHVMNDAVTGGRTVLEWLDSEDRPTRRSRASKERRLSFDSDGACVSVTTKDLSS